MRRTGLARTVCCRMEAESVQRGLRGMKIKSPFGADGTVTMRAVPTWARFGESVAETAEEVRAQLGDAVDLIVDAPVAASGQWPRKNRDRDGASLRRQSGSTRSAAARTRSTREKKSPTSTGGRNSAPPRPIKPPS